jgi:hypothetical protein
LLSCFVRIFFSLPFFLHSFIHHPFVHLWLLVNIIFHYFYAPWYIVWNFKVIWNFLWSEVVVNFIRTNISRYILKVLNHFRKYPSLYSPESMKTELLHTEKERNLQLCSARKWARPILRWPYSHYENIRTVTQRCPSWNMGAISTFLIYFATLHQLFI